MFNAHRRNAPSPFEVLTFGLSPSAWIISKEDTLWLDLEHRHISDFRSKPAQSEPSLPSGLEKSTPFDREYPVLKRLL
jgi:hypothetical protein